MIYDTCVYLDEIDVLTIRLSELDSVVDKFVVVEGNKTFRGVPKETNLDKHSERLKPWIHKIEHAVAQVPDWPVHDFEKDSDVVLDDDLEREKFCREWAKKVIKPLGNDVVIHTDVDEIPSAGAARYFANGRHGIMGFEQKFYRYYLNHLIPSIPWQFAKICVGDSFHSMSCHDLRYWDAARHGRMIPDGGWHFTYMGGYEGVKTKLTCGSHPMAHRFLKKFSELGIEEMSKELSVQVPIDSSLPSAVRDNLDYWNSIGWIHP